MAETCPYDCGNKTEYGYCKSTGCVNPRYEQTIYYNHNPYTFSTDNWRSPCTNCLNNPRNGGSGICFCTLGNPIKF